MRRIRCRKRRRISGQEAFPPSVGLCAEDAPISQFARPMKRPCKERAPAPGLRRSLRSTPEPKPASADDMAFAASGSAIKKDAAENRSVFLGTKFGNGPGLLTLLGGFLISLLGFLCHQESPSDVQRLLPRQGKRTECPLAHGHPIRAEEASVKNNSRFREKILYAERKTARRIGGRVTQAPLAGSFGERTAVVALAGENGEPFTAYADLNRVIVHLAVALGGIGERVLVA